MITDNIIFPKKFNFLEFRYLDMSVSDFFSRQKYVDREIIINSENFFSLSLKRIVGL